MTRVTIDPRFCGPPGIGHGGYVSGLLAEALGGSDVLISLRAPAPLGRALDLMGTNDHARLVDGDVLIAEATCAPLALDVPPWPSVAEAEAASARFDRNAHLYPGCFVCGPGRPAGDGWRIFPGPLAEGRVAATWKPGSVPAVREIWAALDCPGYFAVQKQARSALLAQMQARLFAPLPVGELLVIQGWSLGSRGRKHHAGTALHASDGTLLAAAGQLWVTLAG